MKTGRAFRGARGTVTSKDVGPVDDFAPHVVAAGAVGAGLLRVAERVPEVGLNALDVGDAGDARATRRRSSRAPSKTVPPSVLAKRVRLPERVGDLPRPAVGPIGQRPRTPSSPAGPRSRPGSSSRRVLALDLTRTRPVGGRASGRASAGGACRPPTCSRRTRSSASSRAARSRCSAGSGTATRRIRPSVD